MSTTTPTVQKTAGPNAEQFTIVDTGTSTIFNVRNDTHDEPKDHTYTVITNTDRHATSCTCPHHKYRTAFCKHMAAVEESVRDSVTTDDVDEERVTGPYTGYDKYGHKDHTYWKCEHCGAEATRKSGLDDCCQ